MDKEKNKELDNQLVKRILNGEQNAYQQLVEKYTGLLFSIVLKMVGNKTDAEDLVQEIFIKIYKGLASYNGEFALTTWMMKIASNHTIDYLRKKKLKTTPIDGSESEEKEKRKPQFEADVDNPEEMILKQERKKMIEKAIEELPPRYREVIILRHKEERDYLEIAEKLNIPLGTVKARLFRAREMLNQKLKDQIG
jgi:RNA polymerase sigma-70 factor (ECF subfamily)